MLFYWDLTQIQNPYKEVVMTESMELMMKFLNSLSCRFFYGFYTLKNEYTLSYVRNTLGGVDLHCKGATAIRKLNFIFFLI